MLTEPEALSKLEKIQEICVKAANAKTPPYKASESHYSYYEHCAMHHGECEFANHILGVINA